MSMSMSVCTSLSRPHPFFATPPLSISVQSSGVRLRRLPTVSVSVSTSASAADPDPDPDPKPQSFGPEYLIHSCGLPSDEAAEAYNKIAHLTSPDKPDAVLRFLREIGITDSYITIMVSLDARILDTSVDEILRPNIATLQEAGLSIETISPILSYHTHVFLCSLAPRINFWMDLLGSVENFAKAMTKWGSLFATSLEDTVLPNLRFLEDQCRLSSSQIKQLIMSHPRLLTNRTEFLKEKAHIAEELGLVSSSGMYIYALISLCKVSRENLDARLNNFKTLGFSQEEVNFLISKAPALLELPEKWIIRKIEFLLKEAGCGKTDIVKNPYMLLSSLKNRLIPRNVVRKLLMANGHLWAKNRFGPLVRASEKQFAKKYLLPYEHDIPGLHQAYDDARAGEKIGE